MKKGWQTKMLCELYHVGSSKRVLKSQWKTSGVPFYRGREVTRLAADGFVDNDLFISEDHFADLSKEYGVPIAGDIVITAIGTIGNSHVVRSCDRFYFKDASVLWMKRTSDVSSEFVNLWLKSPSFFDQLDRGNGATVDTLTIQKLQSVKISVPPLPEQQRIVGILDEAFEGIATATANAEKNLQNARALFESHLQSVFSKRGDSPVVPIGDVAEVFDGPHATPKTVDAGPVFLGISALQDGKINLGETRHVTPQDFRQWTRRVKPQADDVVFSYETRLGQAAIIPEGLECCLGRRMGLVRVNRKRVDPRFFVYQYISPSFRRFLDSKTVRGATVDRIALKEFPSFPISLPSLAEQERMTNQLDKLRAETQRLEAIYQQKLAVLDELKKSLLHQAFSGAL